MKITSVAVRACRLPPASPWEDATNKVQGLEFVFVELATDAGLTGFGLTYTVDIGGTAIKALIEDYLGPLVLGMNPLDYEAAWARMNRQSRRLGLGVNAMATAAVDVAVWDVIGKHYGQPLHRLLGGSREAIPAYVSEINLGAGDTLDDLARRVGDYRAQGYRVAKIKIGRDDPQEDVARIRIAQEKLGPGGRVMVDLNQKWSAAEALRLAPRLDALDLGWIEEPMPYQDVAAHAALRRAIRTPLALGESLFSREQFLAYLKAEAVDIVQADVAFVGGVTEWIRIAHLAQAFGKPVAPHYMMELSLPLLCGAPNGFMLENVVGGSLAELGLVRSRVEIVDGLARASEAPGHGVVPDWAAIEAAALRPDELRAGFRGGSK